GGDGTPLIPKQDRTSQIQSISQVHIGGSALFLIERTGAYLNVTEAIAGDGTGAIQVMSGGVMTLPPQVNLTSLTLMVISNGTLVGGDKWMSIGSRGMLTLHNNSTTNYKR
ncbi:unnamed protein product, partial [Choristocarpus tenellus]